MYLYLYILNLGLNVKFLSYLYQYDNKFYLQLLNIVLKAYKLNFININLFNFVSYFLYYHLNLFFTSLSFLSASRDLSNVNALFKHDISSYKYHVVLKDFHNKYYHGLFHNICTKPLYFLLFKKHFLNSEFKQTNKKNFIFSCDQYFNNSFKSYANFLNYYTFLGNNKFFTYRNFIKEIMHSNKNFKISNHLNYLLTKFLDAGFDLNQIYYFATNKNYFNNSNHIFSKEFLDLLSEIDYLLNFKNSVDYKYVLENSFDYNKLKITFFKKDSF